MGIRFEYGARKATNGPVIFFSDPVSEVNLQEEIRGAIASRLSFYAYRLPGDMMVSFGSSEAAVEGLGQPGFVIAPFLPGEQCYTIPYAPTPRSSAQEQFPFPSASTSKDDYLAEIDRILKQIDGKENRKIVAARVKVEPLSTDVAATFMQLLNSYPDAYVFCFSTPQTGCWIGASPELLLSRRAGVFHTMALAGTRPAFEEGPWDSKNILEQRMVTDYITDCLKEAGLNVTLSDTVTRRAGNVEHLCTPIQATAAIADHGNRQSGSTTAGDLVALLQALSPTPAVAGLPRDLALSVIKDSESFPRGFYGGFCGPYRNADEFTFSVILRCARVEKERTALFAGGGITAFSDPEKEWEETDMKLSTLGSLLISEESIL